MIQVSPSPCLPISPSPRLQVTFSPSQQRQNVAITAVRDQSIHFVIPTILTSLEPSQKPSFGRQNKIKNNAIYLLATTRISSVCLSTCS